MSEILLPRIEARIQVVRGLRVMLDVDLAALFGVPTKRLNEQVKRNRERFPADFLFQLDAREKAEVVANCDHLSNLKFSKALPYAFTEHGAIQAANVLASNQATPDGQPRHPPRLQDLLLDPRFATTRRHLRQLYPDPITGRPDWKLVLAPGSGIMGVHSASTARPIKVAHFPTAFVSFQGKTRYSEWVFSHPVFATTHEPHPAPPSQHVQPVTSRRPPLLLFGVRQVPRRRTHGSHRNAGRAMDRRAFRVPPRSGRCGRRPGAAG